MGPCGSWPKYHIFHRHQSTQSPSWLAQSYISTFKIIVLQQLWLHKIIIIADHNISAQKVWYYMCILFTCDCLGINVLIFEVISEFCQFPLDWCFLFHLFSLWAWKSFTNLLVELPKKKSESSEQIKRYLCVNCNWKYQQAGWLLENITFGRLRIGVYQNLDPQGHCGL